MLSSLSLIDEYVVQRTSGLVAYLKELVEQSSERVRDTADDGTIWLDDYQEHLADAGAGELLEIHCAHDPEFPSPPGRSLTATVGSRHWVADLRDTHELLFGVGRYKRRARSG